MARARRLRRRNRVDIVPEPLNLGLGEDLGGVDLSHRGARLVDRLLQSVEREWGRVEDAGRAVRSAGDGIEQVVDVVDRGVLIDHALFAQFTGQFVEIGLRAVGHVAYHGQEHQRRKVQCGETGQVDKIADGLAGYEVLDLGLRLGRFLGPLDAAHVLGEEVEHLADQNRIGFGVVKGLGDQERSRFAQGSTDQSGGRAKSTFGQRKAEQEEVADARVTWVRRRSGGVRFVRHEDSPQAGRIKRTARVGRRGSCPVVGLVALFLYFSAAQ